MILSGQTIANSVASKRIVIKPFDVNNINPNSYNVTLATELKVYGQYTGDDANAANNEFLTPSGVILDARKDNPTESVEIPETGFVLTPGVLYLGKTQEYTETPYHVPMLEGRSSLARLGVCVHITAGFGDRGFKGHWTLEITSVHRIRIYPGMKVAQLCYYDVDLEGPVYAGKYNNKAGSEPGASQLYKDFVK